MKRALVPGIPFLVSGGLSLFTVGSHPYWCDSALYLTAVKELGVLYAPGFVFYEMLCWAWTHLFFFLDFTLAVHLFSSMCAAAACGAIALAVRDLLRSRGPIFALGLPEAGAAGDAAAVLAGVLLATGFTFWTSAIYAKGYALFYLVLTALIWRMIRADDGGRPRDFTIVAVLIGLAWQAHPSSLLIGPALVLFVAVHARALGAKGVAARVLLSAACALGPSLVILPILSAREPWVAFRELKAPGDILRWAIGGHYGSIAGVWGGDASRVASFFRFLWEDLLGIGLLLAVAGTVALVRLRRWKLLAGMAAWSIPYAVVTILFKVECQHDCWFVAVRLPLFLSIGVAGALIGLKTASRGPAVLGAAAAVATAWAAWANGPDAVQRNYEMAELFGRTLMDVADPQAILILSGDDSNGLASYLQRVKGHRTDLILVTASFLNSEGYSRSDWYDERLARRNPDLKRPDYTGLRERFPHLEPKQAATSAFINANADGPRVILTEVLPSPEILRPDLTVIPAGVYWRIARITDGVDIEERYWRFPIQPENIRYRRARGQWVNLIPGGLEVGPEPYERRLAVMILRARFRLALAEKERKQYAHAAELCQSIINFDDEEFNRNAELIHLMGVCYYASHQGERAEPALRRSAEISVRPENRATALFYLGELARKRGDDEAARRRYTEALAVPGLNAASRREIESRLHPK